MTLHPFLSNEQFDRMVTTATSHAQINVTPPISVMEKIRMWFLNRNGRKVIAMALACVFMLMLSMPMMTSSLNAAEDESLDMMNNIISYDSLNQLGHETLTKNPA